MIRDKKLEQFLQKESGKAYHLFTGRGSSALYLVAKVLFTPGDKVIVPPIVCPHLIYGLRLAGIQPVFCDVESKNYVLSFDAVNACLKKDASIKGLVLAEVYGHYLDPRFKSLGEEHKLKIIYDRAQSFGNPSKLIIPEAVEIHSFGYSKPLDVGNGGLIACNNLELYEELFRIEKALPKIKEKDLDDYESKYRTEYYSAVDSKKSLDSIRAFFSNVHLRYKAMLVYRSTVDEDLLLQALRQFPGKQSPFLKQQDFLRGKLKHPLIHLPEIKSGDMQWRYTFLVPEAVRDIIIQRLRDENIHVSAWYPDCSLWFDPQMVQPLANAEQISQSVINLWLGESEDYMNKAIKMVLNCLSNAN